MKRNVLQVVKATIAVAIVTVILLLIMAFMLFKFNLSDGFIMVGIYITYVVSCFVGGLIIGKVRGEKKYLWGMIVGLVFFVTLSLISLIVTGELYGSGMKAIGALVACVLGGAVGGMIAK
ncbi:MAG: TIGR04086 family membrane protein [Lachnospiraceae bacterium]|nr:TIGR04086 family membrane protein [Lachnospiraceae bacterium]